MLAHRAKLDPIDPKLVLMSFSQRVKLLACSKSKAHAY